MLKGSATKHASRRVHPSTVAKAHVNKKSKARKSKTIHSVSVRLVHIDHE